MIDFRARSLSIESAMDSVTVFLLSIAGIFVIGSVGELIDRKSVV